MEIRVLHVPSVSGWTAPTSAKQQPQQSSSNTTTVTPSELQTKRMQALVKEARAQFASIEVDLFPGSGSTGTSTGAPTTWFTVVLRGANSSMVAAARQWLLLRCPRQVATVIRASWHDLLTADHRELKPNVKQGIEEVMRMTRTDILVHWSAAPPSSATGATMLVPVDTDDGVQLEIQGAQENVQRAKNALLASLDVWGQSMFKLSVELEWKWLYILAGRHRHVWRQWMAKTKTHIYLPPYNLLSQRDTDLVWITGGSLDAIHAAKDLLTGEVAQIASKGAAMQVLTIPLRKIEFLYRHRNLEDIMRKNAVTISFTMTPQQNVHILGENKHYVDRAIGDLSNLISSHFTTRILLRQPPIKPNSNKDSLVLLEKKLRSLGQALPVDLLLSGNTVEVNGEAEGTTQIGRRLLEPAFAEMMRDVQDVHIEAQLSMIYKDFITGKKNGKLNKITKSCGIHIDLVEPSAFALLLDLHAANYGNLLDAFQQLRDELPAELEFLVDEHHHKRIIGVAGKNIQSVMKVYGVYVKFAGSAEYASIGGILSEDKNVLARTPAKNAFNLENLYVAVMKQVRPEFTGERSQVLVPRRYLGKIAEARRSLEEQSGALISVASMDSADASVMLVANEEEAGAAEAAIHALVPVTYRCRLTNASALLASADFQRLVAHASQFYRIQLTLKKWTSGSEEEAATGTTLHFQCTRASLQNLPKLLDTFSQLCEAFQVTAPLLLPDHEFSERHREVFAFHGTEQSKDLSVRPSTSPLNRSPSPVHRPPVSPQKSPRGAQLVAPAPIGSQKKSPLLVPNTPENAVTGQITSPGSRMLLISDGMHSATPSKMDKAHRSHGNLVLASEDKKKQQLLHGGSSGSSGIGRSGDGALLDGNSALFTDVHLVTRPRSKTTNATPLKITISDELTREQTEWNMLPDSVRNLVGMDLNGDAKLTMLLESLGMEKYISKFTDNDVDFKTFLTLTEDDMKELGISLGGRRKLSMAITELRGQQSLKQPPATSLIPTMQASSPIHISRSISPLQQQQPWTSPNLIPEEWGSFGQNLLNPHALHHATSRRMSQ